MVTINFKNTLLKIAFKLLYHQLAWTYDFTAAIASAGRWSGWMQATLPFLRGPRILELGYGPGHLLNNMTSEKCDVFGIDLSRQMARLAWKNTHKATNVEKETRKFPHLLQGRAQFLPFAPCSFNSIVSTFPTPYIFDPKSISEFERVLVPEGQLVIAVGAEITGKRWTDRISAWLSKHTGQTVVWNENLDLPFSNSALIPEIITTEYRESKVLIIKAEKSGKEQKVTYKRHTD